MLRGSGVARDWELEIGIGRINETAFLLIKTGHYQLIFASKLAREKATPDRGGFSAAAAEHSGDLVVVRTNHCVEHG